ncbi:hypothetical protein ACLOJK_032658 [Asimina triloba]
MSSLALRRRLTRLLDRVGTKKRETSRRGEGMSLEAGPPPHSNLGRDTLSFVSPIWVVAVTRSARRSQLPLSVGPLFSLSLSADPSLSRSLSLSLDIFVPLYLDLSPFVSLESLSLSIPLPLFGSLCPSLSGSLSLSLYLSRPLPFWISLSLSVSRSLSLDLSLPLCLSIFLSLSLSLSIPLSLPSIPFSQPLLLSLPLGFCAATYKECHMVGFAMWCFKVASD